MKKYVLMVAVVLVMATTGFVIARHQRANRKFPPHTIVYRLTFYDESEKLVSTDVLIRRVEADGSWKHTQIKADGSVQFSNGKLKGFLTSRQLDPDAPAHLDIKYIGERNRKGDADTWISPELQDYLLFTTFRSDGSKDMEMKAVDINRPNL
jgi:hypothetical protein